MKLFICRLICSVLIYGTLFIHTIHEGVAITSTLFLVTGILFFYFLMPIIHKPLINYIMILFLIILSNFTTSSHLYWLPLIGFFVVEATFQLKGKQYYFFYAFSIAACIFFGIFHNIQIYVLLLMATIFVVSYLLFLYVENSLSKGAIYEQLIMEYRLLKRKSVEQELLVRAEERTKIARDFHDSVGHKMTSLLMQLEIISIQNKTDSLEVAKDLARESLEETRYAVRQLKSAETTGIQSVIQLIRKLEMESRLHIHFTLKNGVLSLPISNTESIVLYRVLQESLTNAMKHSHSKEVEVILGINSLHNLHFEVTNKLLSDRPVVQGFGLTNMEERLKEIGGELKVLRTEQQFILTGSIPINGLIIY
ncbi:sensor histidine kinase [Lysinibacillus sp. SGAir0095]|uniref:sensor histidine kinase n=1 Tax=Lysinibacillus sp. SGAir0095 TaxID=2070463 RepID=UPI0010F85F38|nr:histidine kinase [Lysinibacillus sp. SGAir0095]